MAINPFNLPVSSMPFVDTKTGMVNRTWYLYLQNLFQILGSGGFGTTTQTLHGGAAGFRSLDLSSDVIGLLPTGNISSAAVTSVKIASNAVANSQLSQVPPNTLKGNNTGVTSNPVDLTVSQVLTMLNATVTQNIGSWTPLDNSGAGLAFSGVSANFTQIGNMIFAYAQLTYPVTASGAGAQIAGLPATVANANYAQIPHSFIANAGLGSQFVVPVKNTASFLILDDLGGSITNVALSTATLKFGVMYPAT